MKNKRGRKNQKALTGTGRWLKKYKAKKICRDKVIDILDDGWRN